MRSCENTYTRTHTTHTRAHTTHAHTHAHARTRTHTHAGAIGRRYFVCRDKHGIFVRRAAIADVKPVWRSQHSRFDKKAYGITVRASYEIVGF